MNTQARYCKDHSNRILSGGICLVSDESCVRCKQQRLMKRLGKAQPPWPINICVCTSNLACDLSPWTSEALACAHSPEVCHTCDKNGASLTVTFHEGSYDLSTSVTRSHFPVRGVEWERSGAAWHPTRKRCGAEAASDNASCWECRQPLVHLFSPLNHRSPNRKLLLRHLIYLISPLCFYLEV